MGNVAVWIEHVDVLQVRRQQQEAAVLLLGGAFSIVKRFHCTCMENCKQQINCEVHSFSIISNPG